MRRSVPIESVRALGLVDQMKSSSGVEALTRLSTGPHSDIHRLCSDVQVFWFIPDFLDRYCPLDVPRVDPVDPMTLRKVNHLTTPHHTDQPIAPCLIALRRAGTVVLRDI